MIGFEVEYYTIANADGHDLVLNVDNYFLTEDIAVEKAVEVCQDYKDTVLIKRHRDRIVRAFRARVLPEEIADTTTVAS